MSKLTFNEIKDLIESGAVGALTITGDEGELDGIRIIMTFLRSIQAAPPVSGIAYDVIMRSPYTKLRDYIYTAPEYSKDAITQQLGSPENYYIMHDYMEKAFMCMDVIQGVYDKSIPMKEVPIHAGSNTIH